MILHIEDRYDRDNLYVFYRDRYEVVPKSLYTYSFSLGGDIRRFDQGMREVFLSKNPSGSIERTLKPKIRYINDNKLYPEYKIGDLSVLTFDIEVYNEDGFPDSSKDRILSIAYRFQNVEDVIYSEDEGDTIREFFNVIRGYNPDLLSGYNIDRFDLPYLIKRAKTLNIDVDIGRYGLEVKNNIIPGRIVIDVYRMMILLNRFGIIDLDEFSLSYVYSKIFGERKMEVDKDTIWYLWHHNRDKLLEYNLDDVRASERILKKYLPLFIELSNISRMYLQDLIRSFSSGMVENLILTEAYGKYIIPDTYGEHEEETYEGGYVKSPKPGLYSNIAVLDFASMYPSIIISNNIDYYTYINNRDFLKEPMGLIPTILKRLVDERNILKRMLKERYDDTIETKSQALKILANSFYGYMAYRRSRFYLKEAAEKVAEIGRKTITRVIDMAEREGFRVIYADTDSIFIIYNTEDAVREFVDRLNSSLSGYMKIELEGLYTRGLFVHRKDESEGAKKKYALLRSDGKMKIRGFELVRRDWCQLARDIQQEVLDIVLREGNVERAVARVRDVIKDLRERKVNPERLVIYTRLSKRPEDYDRDMPEVVAARKMGLNSANIMNRVIKYIIVSGQGSISSRAEPYEQFVRKPYLKYDVDYYIDHQILPAVLRVLSAFDYNESSFRTNLKQNTLI
ncbi:MAG: DNA-directed DNA polymerase [Candidatus Micrarchaeota archaeon]|nr:DNA-directed DNA polymerase [Candidatus Micrarchaeota archaeon]MCX8154499.1 DNA-directed DNA polymerase [Candidatus Micrarchaeota archaeon]